LWIAERARRDQPFAPATNLGPAINSTENDQDAWLSPDGLTLIFTSDRTPGRYHDLYVATRKSRGESFVAAVPIAELNMGSSEQSGALSSDGKTIYFTVSGRPGGEGAADVWIATRDASTGKFVASSSLGPPINSPQGERFPWLSGDDRLLVFNRKSPDPAQDGDIWFATRPRGGGAFSPPTLIGPPISLPETNEGQASLTTDGEMYFASARPGGVGGLDIWVSRRVPKSLASPSTPAAPLPPGDYALEFDGIDDGIEVPSLGKEYRASVTLEAWVRPSRLIEQADLMVLGDDSGSRFRLKEAGTHWHALLGIAGTQWKYAFGQAKAGQRDHIAGVWSGNNLRIFVNGISTNDVVVGDALQAGLEADPLPGRLRIGFGHDDNGSAKRFAGTIDELRVSQSARYDKNFTPELRFTPDAQTIALYHFDEGTGDQLVDSSGNGFDGRITGAKWVKKDGVAVPAGK
jgi:hypothetical protein